MKHKINLVFEQLSLQRIIIGNIIKKCIHSTLDAEGVKAGCEINVLVTDDAGIQIGHPNCHEHHPRNRVSYPSD